MRSVDELIRAGEQPEYLYFWGHQPSGDGVGPSCLSQWWPAEFVVGGRAYPTAEHFMMSEKALLFGDADIAGQILRTTEPKEAKQLGRQIVGFDEARWRQRRIEVVVEGNLAKFGQHPALRDYLLGTGDAVLVEASARPDLGRRPRRRRRARRLARVLAGPQPARVRPHRGQVAPGDLGSPTREVPVAE